VTPVLANCSECGRLYPALQPGLCPDCRQQEEAEFDQVRRYLQDHPSADVADVAAGTGVSERRILHFLRTGRLRLQGTSQVLACRFCGVPLDSGHICPACAERMRRQLAPERKAGSPKMYTFDRRLRDDGH